MPTIPQPSQLINCSDLSSCFQTIYNFFFAILVALAFLYFLYGAFQYLLSGGGIFNKEQAKSKMKNSIIALIVVLIIPVILNLINPGIFRGIEIYIPTVTTTLPELYAEMDQSAVIVSSNTSGTYFSVSRSGSLSQYLCFTSYPVYEVSVSQEIVQYNGYPVHKLVANALNNCVNIKLGESGVSYQLTQGYNPGSFDKSHQLGYGIDIYPIPSSLDGYNALTNALVSCGFTVLNESGMVLNCKGKNLPFCPNECMGGTLKPGCPCAWTGPHLHASLEVQQISTKIIPNFILTFLKIHLE